jgi:hypothetical protein
MGSRPILERYVWPNIREILWNDLKIVLHYWSKKIVLHWFPTGWVAPLLHIKYGLRGPIDTLNYTIYHLLIYYLSIFYPLLYGKSILYPDNFWPRLPQFAWPSNVTLNGGDLMRGTIYASCQIACKVYMQIGCVHFSCKPKIFSLSPITSNLWTHA